MRGSVVRVTAVGSGALTGARRRRSAEALAALQRIERAQSLTALGIDQFHGTQVPAGIGDVQRLEVAKPRRDLEAFAFQAAGAVAATLNPAAEGAA